LINPSQNRRKAIAVDKNEKEMRYGCWRAARRLRVTTPVL